MSQDNLIKLECTECGKLNYYSTKNKKTIKARLAKRGKAKGE